jgi:(p)ppGpp synthase/HD superfamily hydrolase
MAAYAQSSAGEARRYGKRKTFRPSNSAMPGKRFQEALVYASRLHAGQTRKGTQIPYISHLLAVAAIVLEDGGDEDQAIAALLHDAVEDQGGRETLDAIRSPLWGEGRGPG